MFVLIFTQYLFYKLLACVASVSVGLSAGLKHFWLALAPIFCAINERKTPRTGGKPYGNACYAGYVLKNGPRLKKDWVEETAE